jgi:hypothetical protein
MFPWQRREVLITNSAEKFGRAESALREGGIRYDTKVFDSGMNRRPGVGRFGERTELQVFYYIYVRAADVERAEYLISQIR